MKILEFIIHYLKTNKISFSIDGDLIQLHVGSYEGFIQLEGSGCEEDDYNTMQTWVTNDNRFSNEIFHESSGYELSISECEEMILQLLNACKETNKGIAKLLNLIDSAKEILEEYNIPSSYFLTLIEEKI